MKTTKVMALATPMLVLALGGCATTTPEMDEVQRELADAKARAEQLQSSVSGLEGTVQRKDAEIQSLQSRLQTGATGDPLLPPQAKPGECYARVFIPPAYTEETRQVLRQEGGERIETTPPEYEWVEERVLVKEASQRLEVVPATYDWAEERVMVRQASEELQTVPAKYEWTEEQVLVRAAYTTWKKGRGPIERIDNATGEIMCLVEVPAEYKTVRKQVMVSPPSTRKVAIPAEYTNVRKRVMVEAPKTRTIEIPAEYKTVRVKKLVRPAGERRIKIDPTYQTVTERKLVSEGHLEWRPILCETNTSPDIVRKIQSALLSAGHNPGRIDGVIGPDTMRAVTAYQREKGQPSGQLTIQTLRSLGVL
ncbi:MAG: peptidoglycan-binding protein [Ectothiorhodospiraceae bacterium]|nr:peptidoglycan-binding protein [Ectothiorhodospiraceae bacterium]